MPLFEQLTDGEGVGLVDYLNMPTGTYNRSFNSAQDMLAGAFYIYDVENTLDQLIVGEVENAFLNSSNGWVRVGKVVDSIQYKVSGKIPPRWRGLAPVR